jgi:hypothetical protein
MIMYRLNVCGGGKDGMYLTRARGGEVFPVSESTWRSVLADRKISPAVATGMTFGGSPLLGSTVATMRAQQSARSG